MMDVKEFDWKPFWEVFRDILLPESGVLVWNLVLCTLISFAVSVLLLALGNRFGLFRREPKYYNWAVKLYIPLILITTVYFGLQIGLFRGIWQVADAEAPRMAEGVYALTVDQVFEDDAAKTAFLKDMKVLALTYAGEAEQFSQVLKDSLMQRKVGIEFADKVWHSAAAWLIDQFDREIYAAIVTTVLSEAAKKAGIPVELSWSQSAKVIDVLVGTDVAHLEVEIQHKLGETLQKLFSKQYSSARNSSLLLWALIALLGPLIEWAIYIWIVKPRLAAKSADTTDTF